MRVNSSFSQNARNNKYDVSKYASKVDFSKIDTAVDESITNYPAFVKEEVVIIQPIWKSKPNPASAIEHITSKTSDTIPPTNAQPKTASTTIPPKFTSSLNTRITPASGTAAPVKSGYVATPRSADVATTRTKTTGT